MMTMAALHRVKGHKPAATWF